MIRIAVIFEEPSVRRMHVYGVTPLERLMRQCRTLGYYEIWVVRPDAPPVSGDAGGSVRWLGPGTLPEAVRGIQDAAEFYLIGSDAVVDDRLLAFILHSAPPTRIATPEGSGPLLAKVNEEMMSALTPYESADAVRANLERNHTMPVKYPRDFDPYIDELRLRNEPYLFRLTDGTDIRRIEHRMYEANFKGTLDFIAVYIYKYPVREITRWLSRYRWVTPNQITFLSIVSSLAVPALFALGQTGWAIAIGWLMFILDSVDGKLARLTVRLSKTAGAIEHATSSPALFLWFPALGWFLSGGRLFDPGQPAAVAAWILMAVYWVDKGVNSIFRKKFLIDLYTWSVFDQKFHLVACRRAIILLIITAGYLMSDDSMGILALAGWMIVSFLVHVVRFVMISAENTGRKV